MDILELIASALGPNQAEAAPAPQPQPDPAPSASAPAAQPGMLNAIRSGLGGAPDEAAQPPPTNRLAGFAQAGNITRPPQSVGTMPQPQPMTDQIRGLFAGQPTPQQPRQPQPYQPPANGGAWQTGTRLVPPAPPAAQQPPALSPEAADMQRAIRAFFTGAAGVNPSSPKFSAFAQGAGGAMQSRYKEGQAEEKQRQDQANKRFDRDLKIAKDDREERASKRADRAEVRAEGKDKRDAQSAEVLNTARTTRVMKMLDPNLDVKDRIAIERLVRDYGRDMARRDPTLDDATAIQRMEAYRKEVEGRVRDKKQVPASGGGAAPAAPKPPGTTPSAPAAPPKPQSAPAPAAPKPGQSMGGYTFKGGDPSDPANWEQAQ